MTVFVDTSALFAALDAADSRHQSAVETFERVAAERLATHNYVAVEAEALVRRKLGATAAHVLLVDILPSLATTWVDEELHRAGVTATLAAGMRRLSLVDCVSFEVMRRQRIDTAFAFDRHFAEQGFATIP